MKQSKNGENTIKIYVLLNAIRVFGVALFAATNIIFLLERGLNLYEVNLVAFAAIIVTLCFEIPTGAIADVYGRKISFVYSCFIVSFGLILYTTSSSLFIFAIASSIVAIGYTLESGAFTAWLVDSLEYHSCSASLQNVLIKDMQVRAVTGILGIICGAFIADINIAIPWILASIITAITGILAIFLMKEKYFKQQTLSFSKNISKVKWTIKASIHCIKKSNVVKFLFLLGIIQAFSVQSSANHWQPYFSQLFESDITLGYLRSGMLIATIFGATLSSHMFKKKTNKNKILILLQIIIGLGIFLSGSIVYLPIIIIVFLLISFTAGMFEIIRTVYINENIPSQERATILSFMSMAYSLGAGAGLIFSGYIAEQSSISFTWIITGLILIFFTLLFLKKDNRVGAIK